MFIYNSIEITFNDEKCILQNISISALLFYSFIEIFMCSSILDILRGTILLWKDTSVDEPFLYKQSFLRWITGKQSSISIFWIWKRTFLGKNIS